MLVVSRFTKFTVILASIVSCMLLAFGHARAADNVNIEGNLSCGANVEFKVTDGSCEADGGVDAAERVDKIVSQVINIMSLVVAVVAVVMIIIGGLKYITSGGESGNVTGAKNTILYAVVGLVVVALAQVIVRFVVDTTVGSASSSATTD